MNMTTFFEMDEFEVDMLAYVILSENRELSYSEARKQAIDEIKLADKEEALHRASSTFFEILTD